MELPVINQKLDVTILKGDQRSAFSTYVADRTSHSLDLAHPRVDGRLIAVSPGDLVHVEFAVRGAARVAFDTRVTELAEEGVPVIRVALPTASRIDRVQQRDFVRLETRIALTYSVLSFPDQAVVPRGLFQSHTRDLSANGGQVLCFDYYPSGTQLDIYMELNGDLIHLVGEVIRHISTDYNRQVWTGIRFVGLAEKDRELLVRYVFNQQRELRRRGLL